MTKNEIIKARENGIIKTLEYRAKYSLDIGFSKDVLDLIKYYKIEIERLHKKVEELSEVLSDSIRIRYKEAKSEAIKDFAERINPIIEQLVEIMFDSNQQKCMIKNCHKYSSIPCESPTCIDENKAFWKLMIYNIVKQLEENE